MKKSEVRISLIIPCYNEHANIEKGVIDKIGEYTKSDERFEEVIIVDDGSSDDSRDMIKKKYLPKYKKFRLVQNNHQGKAFAIMRGINESKGNFVMFSDMDLATPIEETDKLTNEIKNGYEVIIGSRKMNREGAPFARKVLSFGSVIVRDYFMGLKGIRDTQCGFKLFQKDAAMDIMKRLQVFHNQSNETKGASVSAGFDMEFLFVASKLGYKIKEVSVIWKHVESRRVSFVKDAKEALRDIIAIKLNELRHKYNFAKS
jgi:glycosyltransferase involved in cell wall biosynthesis